MIPVDIGIFAHNEAGRIGNALDDLLKQDLVSGPQGNAILHVLANGCTDTTVEEARSLVAARGLQDRVMVHDLPEGGKSRTWNRFVHDLSRPEAEYFIFFDADCRIPEPHVLRGLVEFLSASPGLDAASSKAVKDIVHDPGLKRGPLDTLIVTAAGTLNEWRHSISGGLYILRASVGRGFHLPIGLPTEDGFVAAMVKSRNFDELGSGKIRIDGKEELFYIYESERGVGALLRHQTRLVVGGAINDQIYSRLNALPTAERLADLERSARDPDWLPALLHEKLPRRPYGYVPFAFLTKRVRFWRRSPDRFRPRRLAVVTVGFVFDAIVYLRAQYVMWRGQGAGFW
jgi:glycosyltransferase involved in cell wall biosynthesis